MFNNWPSPRAVAENMKNAEIVRNSVERLTQSPPRNSPRQRIALNQNLKQTIATIKKPRNSVDPNIFSRN